MIYIYAQFYWYLVLSILYVVLCLLLFYNSTQTARCERQVPHSPESPANFGTNWASLLNDNKKNKKIYEKKIIK